MATKKTFNEGLDRAWHSPRADHLPLGRAD